MISFEYFATVLLAYLFVVDCVSSVWLLLLRNNSMWDGKFLRSGNIIKLCHIASAHALIKFLVGPSRNIPEYCFNSHPSLLGICYPVLVQFKLRGKKKTLLMNDRLCVLYLLIFKNMHIHSQYFSKVTKGLIYSIKQMLRIDLYIFKS